MPPFGYLLNRPSFFQTLNNNSVNSFKIVVSGGKPSFSKYVILLRVVNSAPFSNRLSGVAHKSPPLEQRLSRKYIFQLNMWMVALAVVITAYASAAFAPPPAGHYA